MINARIGQIDALLSEQLNAIMHHEDFQKLEASWRGLHYLVHQSETGTMLKIQVLNVSKKDLLKDMERAPSSTRAPCSRRSTRRSSAPSAAHPFGALVGDYEFSRHPQDIALLEKISNVAAAAHAPFIAAASPQLFNWDDFTEMSGPRDLSKIFEHARVRQVAVVPRLGGLALRRPLPAAHPDAAALRPRHRRRSRRSTSRRTSTAPTTRSTSGATPPTPSPPG